MGLWQQLSLHAELVYSAMRRKRGPVFANNKGALSGYDVVAYFVNGQPTVGQPDFSVKWNGAIWYFSSEANRQLFEATPEKFAPQFGGFCAYGVHNGYKIDSDPACWTIVGGRLFLNYNERLQAKWRANSTTCIEVASQNWPGLKKKWY